MSRFAWMAATLGITCLPWVGFSQESDEKILDGHNLLAETAATEGLSATDLQNLRFRDTLGKAHYLEDLIQQGPAVFVFMSTKCPLAKRYTQRLERLRQKYADAHVQFIAVFPNLDETRDGINDYASKAQYQFPTVHDVDGSLTRSLGATMTPQAFVVDTHGVIRYRGGIDDHRIEDRVKAEYLSDALAQVVSGHAVHLATTTTLGCTIHRADKVASEDVTYASHVARILQDNCQSCHRDGQVAPFALTNYEEAKQWRTEIAEYTQARLMPPWKASPGFAEYTNDCSLSEEEIAILSAWVENDAPLGDPDLVPPTPVFNDDWAFGEPDLIVEMPEEYVIGPEGEDDYRHFVIPYQADQHRFIRAIDVRPGNRSVVHHVIGYLDTSGRARELDAEDEGPGYTRFGGTGFQAAGMIGGWAPGNQPAKTPQGTGRFLPKVCDIVLQVHYYRTGIEERDRTKVGIYFVKDPHPVPTRIGVVINDTFTIPAGEADYTVEASRTLEHDSYLFGVTPHMHLIGQTMTVTAHTPDGEVIPVVKIDDWDFNWQTTYYFKEFQVLPKGTQIKLTATFDNSSDNPNNPNSPPEDISWGERTTDEMCIAFLDLIHAGEYDPVQQGRRPPAQAPATSASAQ